MLLGKEGELGLLFNWTRKEGYNFTPTVTTMLPSFSPCFALV